MREGTCKVTYTTWASMKTRCLNQKSTFFHRYGGRGISVCERRLTYDNFVADMGFRPSRRHSIERIDNDGNYEPGNCRWAVSVEQARNKHKRGQARQWSRVLGKGVVIEFGGKSRTIRGWAVETGLPAHILRSRFASGMDAAKALTMPVKTK